MAMSNEHKHPSLGRV